MLKLEKEVIQGGMGAGVSNFRLARKVSSRGGLGVVSGTALDTIMVRRLQDHKLDVELIFALENFPDKKLTQKIIDKYFKKGRKSKTAKYHPAPYPRFKQDSKGILSLKDSSRGPNLEELLIVSNFVEVFLAKQGHSNPVGINYLHKIQWPLMPSIYGAMIADVDVVLIGAGLPKEIPEVMENISEGKNSKISIPVIDGKDYLLEFDPKVLSEQPKLDIPFFLGIVSNHLGVKAVPQSDGYVFEGEIAGGHNAPARSKELNEKGEPNYGKKDEIDEGKLNMLLGQNSQRKNNTIQPYWLAGGYANKLNEALEMGADGIQVGTPFAFSRESGIEPKLKRKVIQEIMGGTEAHTSPIASPTGFPLKVVQVKDTLSQKEIYDERERICNLGYLVELYERDGEVDTRCPADDLERYEKDGGNVEDTIDKVCLCNALTSTVGLGSPGEVPLVTSGSDFSVVKALVKEHGIDYGVEDVMRYILKS
ncbi:MAG: nitronate monooxygenase [Candidatus Nanoarchaeia archaeon]|jgi:nitronate monooxygenase|nr:nitronate monooxygenase [Candidatus Nanoarchaeia archaeon]|tara:strand:- start:49857 stop:51293 length:1437 start_codon:yes stop_codon:yes gene_type:complete